MKNLLFLFLCLSICVQAAELRGRVVAVSDGDTVTVLDAERHQHKVRLAGIDAPEKAQAFGQASKISLSDQIFGREVAVTWDKRDRYGRIIGKISVDHRDVCLEQIRRGMAWHYKQYARDQAPDDRVTYAEAEVAARAARADAAAEARRRPASAVRTRPLLPGARHVTVHVQSAISPAFARRSLIIALTPNFSLADEIERRVPREEWVALTSMHELNAPKTTPELEWRRTADPREGRAQIDAWRDQVLALDAREWAADAKAHPASYVTADWFGATPSFHLTMFTNTI